MDNIPQEFISKTIFVPEIDCDLVLVFPDGGKVTIQARYSYADEDEDYPGSLDFLLPDTQLITIWDKDMKDAKALDERRPHERLGCQIITDLPRPHN